jgi:hypothetical protein
MQIDESFIVPGETEQIEFFTEFLNGVGITDKHVYKTTMTFEVGCPGIIEVEGFQTEDKGDSCVHFIYNDQKDDLLRYLKRYKVALVDGSYHSTVDKTPLPE